MKKIKIIGVAIVVFLIALVFVSFNIDTNNNINDKFQNSINQQKTTTLEIAKEVLYIYKNQHSSVKKLNQSIKIFLTNIDNINSKDIQKQSKIFYKYIEKFLSQTKVTTPYTNIILEKTVKNIYNTNLILTNHFDKLILAHKNYHQKTSFMYKYIQFGLFFILALLFSYLIIYISTTNNKFEILINKIDNSIKSIDQIEENVEKYLKNISLTKDEDLIIESLEELMSSSVKLKQLKTKLELR
jgi:predicted PurR-regulated permease PerM